MNPFIVGYEASGALTELLRDQNETYQVGGVGPVVTIEILRD
jgi:hypothetical protein